MFCGIAAPAPHGQAPLSAAPIAGRGARQDLLAPPALIVQGAKRANFARTWHFLRLTLVYGQSKVPAIRSDHGPRELSKRDRGALSLLRVSHCGGASPRVRPVRHKLSRLQQSRSARRDLSPKRCAPAGGIAQRRREIFGRSYLHLRYRFPFEFRIAIDSSTPHRKIGLLDESSGSNFRA